MAWHVNTIDRLCATPLVQVLPASLQWHHGAFVFPLTIAAGWGRGEENENVFARRGVGRLVKGLSSLGALVYSTDHGRMCPTCRQPLARCACKASDPPAGNGAVRVSRQTKGRGGKAVTAITGLALSGEALAQLGKQLKTLCGSGGTVKDGVIEIQGDHVERVVDALKKSGHAAKRSGG